jgi:multisubunit Na+/H+ antiporter MnhE subunit
VMFGLSAVSAVILTTFATGVFWGGATTHAVTITAGTEWGYFCALFLGWLAAMAGASTGVARRALGTTAPREPIQMRPAA